MDNRIRFSEPDVKVPGKDSKKKENGQKAQSAMKKKKVKDGKKKENGQKAQNSMGNKKKSRAEGQPIVNNLTVIGSECSEAKQNNNNNAHPKIIKADDSISKLYCRNKKFYRNLIFESDDAWFCFLCNVTFATMEEADSHCNVGRHSNTACYPNLPEDWPMYMYGIAISSAFIPSSFTVTECHVCDVGIATMDEMIQHISTGEHQARMNMFKERLQERLKIDIMKKASSSSKPKKKGKENTKSANVQGPTKQRNAAVPVRPLICNFRLVEDPPANEEAPVRPPKTWATIETNVVKDDSFSSDFPEISSKKKSSQASPVASNRTNNCNKLSELTENFIVDSSHALYRGVSCSRRNKKKFGKYICYYCLLCCCEIPDFDGKLDHACSLQHVESRKKYGCDNIAMTPDNKYYCTFCERKINDLHKLVLHVTGKEHEVFSFSGDATSPSEEPTSSASALACDDEASNATNSTPDRSPSPQIDEVQEEKIRASSPRNVPCDFIRRHNGKRSFCQICDVEEYPVLNKQIEEHVNGSRHALAYKRYGCDQIISLERDTYYCHCCDRVINNLNNVYLHVKDKKHTSSLIKSDKQPSESEMPPEREESSNGVEDVRLKNVLGSYIYRELQNRRESEDPEKPKLNLILSSIQEELSSYLDQMDGNKKTKYMDAMNFEKLCKTAAEKRGRFQYSCSLCRGFSNKVYPECEELHVHMARHFVKEYFSDDEDSDDDPYWDESPKPEAAGITNGVNGSSEAVAEPLKAMTTEELESLLSELSKLGTPSGSTEDRVEEIRSDSTTVVDKVAIKVPEHKNPETDDSDSETIKSEKLNHVEEKKKNTDNCIFDSSEWDGNRERRVARPLASVAISDIARTKEDSLNPALKRSKRNRKRNFDPKVVKELLDFKGHWIYDLNEKLKDIKLGLDLSLPIDSERIYCLICRAIVPLTTLEKYFDHLCSLDHCYYLEMMEEDNTLFTVAPEQLSDLDLAEEYMEEVSDHQVRCVACEIYVDNEDRSLKSHMKDKSHGDKARNLKSAAARNFVLMKKRLSCDWYGVETYWCVPCGVIMENECRFLKHLSSKNKHFYKVRRMKKKCIMDFCPDCAVLWFGYRSTYCYHTKQLEHKWLAKENYYTNFALSSETVKLLKEAENYVKERIKYLDRISAEEAAREEKLIRDLEEVARIKFPRAKAHIFGSRISGIGSDKSDIDIFLDCRNVYNGNDSTLQEIKFFMTGVHEKLSQHPECWDVEELVQRCRSPIIRAYHRDVELNCDISFTHGLSVENSKLIRAYNKVYPTCRELILILKQWAALCDLSGKDYISNYAFYWLVIFFFQNQSILPSVASLIEEKKSSKIIGGWETGVTYNFSYYEPSGSLTLMDYMKKFFIYYGNFDYRTEVICPLLGETVPKSEFLYPLGLPKAMGLYIKSVRFASNAEPLRIDSDMCIQDPFDLAHNLTKAVSKVCLNRFRTCCLKSYELLSSLDTK